jgi:hypothetical protein
MTTIWTRANTGLLLLVLTALVSLIAMLASGVRGGPLDPPGPPASTGTQLIFQPANCGGFPIAISAGSYELAGNITMPGGCAKNGIEILTENVTLDLRGFTLVGTGGALGGISVDNGSSRENIVIRNGGVRNWPGGGIDAAAVGSGEITHVELTSNGPTAGDAQIAIGYGTILSDCVVTRGINSALGIAVSGNGNTVTRCLVNGNAAQGLQVLGAGNRISSNHVTDNDRTTGCADIWVDGPANFLVENTAGAGTLDSCPFYIGSLAAGSTFVRNIARGGGVNNYTNFCGPCDIAVVVGSTGATNPWANLSY